MRIISGKYKGRLLKTTTGPGFRPAMGVVREALFSMLDSRGIDWPATRVLDLFAGSGSLGLEALSRGAARVVFVESAPYAVKVINKNIEILQIEQEKAGVIQTEAAKVLSRPASEPFGLVFIDPPYRDNVLSRILALLVKNNWIEKGGIINAEVEARQKVNPVSLHSGLELLEDRTYGQTRVLLFRN